MGGGAREERRIIHDLQPCGTETNERNRVWPQARTPPSATVPRCSRFRFGTASDGPGSQSDSSQESAAWNYHHGFPAKTLPQAGGKEAR